MTITVGNEAINRDAYAPYGYTYILIQNPATESGKITKVKVYCEIAPTGFEVGIFYKTDTNDFTCRSHTAIENVLLGYSEHDVDLDIEPGDYIGCYYGTGRVDRTDSGDGAWYLEGDNIPCTEATFTVSSDRTMSLQGTGVVTGLGRSKAIVVG